MSANVRSVSRGRFRLLRKNIQRELGAALRASTFPFVSGVPVQLCDIAELTAAYALWSRSGIGPLCSPTTGAWC